MRYTQPGNTNTLVQKELRRYLENYFTSGFTGSELALRDQLNRLYNELQYDKELADLMTRRILKHEPEKQNIRLINVLFVNGEYDWLIMFSAPDHATARRYYDSLRIAYGDFLLEKPTIVDVNFALVREGKANPEVMKLHEFVPTQ